MTCNMGFTIVLVIGALLLSCYNADGAEYYLGYIPHFTLHPTIIMTTTESTPVYYRIEAPGVDYCFNGTIIPNIQNVVDLPRNLTGKSNTFPEENSDGIPKGIYLKTSSDEVTVVGQSGGHNTIDTFLAVPIKNLCLNEYVYYPFSVAAYVRADASFAIVGTEDETTMTITVSVKSKISFNSTADWEKLDARKKRSYVINRLQTVYVSAYLIDLTGSKITADKPLSVISGHECAFVPKFTSACDHLVEQVLPTALWGTTYYIAPLAIRRSYTLKIVAAYNYTKLQVVCNGTETNFVIDDGEYVKQVYGNQEYCAVYSNKKISVVQLSHGTSEDNVGDPMMTLVPAVNDYSNKIISSTSHDATFTGHNQFLNIIVMPEYYQPNLINVNAGSMNVTLESYNWVPIVVSNTTKAYASQIYLNFSEGIFQVTHFNNSALMSAVHYGFLINEDDQHANSRAGYGHPAGLNILRKYSEYHGTCAAADNANNQIVSDSDYICECTDERGCTPEVDNCSPNPCLNNGTCIDDGVDFTCICTPGFIDDNCGISIDDCFNNDSPCENNGTCVDLPVSYLCICPEGYTGKNCSIAPQCSSNPCQNNGVCTDTNRGYICTCNAGFTGDTCGETIDDCSVNSCKNNGICVYADGSFMCSCPPDFSGPDCSVSVSLKNQCDPNPCQNNGECITQSNNASFTCFCTLEYTGSFCELKRVNPKPSTASSSSLSSCNEDDHFIPGFFVGMATGAVIIIVVVIIIVLVRKKYFNKQNNSTTSFGLQKLENGLDDASCDSSVYQVAPVKDKETLVDEDSACH